MSQTAQKPIKPLISPEKMAQILSSRPSITSEEAWKEMEIHTGKKRRPAYKQVVKNGENIWVQT